MSERTRTWAGAAVLFIAPVVFLAGALAHPFVADYTRTSVVADAVRAAPGQWAVAHLLLAIGLGLMPLAVLPPGNPDPCRVAKRRSPRHLRHGRRRQHRHRRLGAGLQ
jgi:hypothetical protein